MKYCLVFIAILFFITCQLHAAESICRLKYSQFHSYELYLEARKNKGKVVGAYISEKIKSFGVSAKELWKEDYLGAWKSGENLPDSIYQFTKRTVLAPRSRQKNPALRLDELKKFDHWAFIIDPALDGVVEISSKLKQKIGPRIGMSAKPLETHLSLPVNLIAGGFLYGTIFDSIFGTPEEKMSTAADDGVLGAPYAEEVVRLGIMSATEARSILNEHGKILIDWIQQSESKNRNRPIPPRFYQFRAEGLLKDQEESEFERIILDVLSDNRKREMNKQTPFGDSYIKMQILHKLRESKTFQSKKDQDLQLLTLVFDPPLQLGSGIQGYGWINQIKTGNTNYYLENIRPHSDIFWLKAAQLSPELKSAEEYFGSDPSYSKAQYIYSQQLTENKKIILEKSNQAGFLPDNKKYLAKRTDLLLYVEPKLAWMSGDGKLISLEQELDYWNLLVTRPEFNLLKVDWLSGKKTDYDTIRELRRIIPGLAELHALQVEKIKLAKVQNPERELPLDPAPSDVCLLREQNPYFQREVATLTTKMNSVNDPLCSYLAAVEVWRRNAVMDLDARERNYVSNEEYENKFNIWLLKAERNCKVPDRKQKILEQLEIKTPEDMNLLACEK